MNNIVLRRWIERLGKSEYMIFSDGKIISIGNRPAVVHGGYANYNEGLFAAWLIENSLYIYCNGKITKYSEQDVVTWQSFMTRREFCISDKSEDKVKFKYLTLYKSLKDYLVLDDDWLPYNDFPSFIDSCCNMKRLDSLTEWANGI